MKVSSDESLDLLWDRIADALVDPGYIILDHPFDNELLCALLDNLQSNHNVSLTDAGIGRGQDYHVNHVIRGDKIHWLELGIPAVTKFLTWMDMLRSGLNERLFLGLHDYESHYAVYEAGSFYRKHRDAFKGQSRRKISTVLYLNPHWPASGGGELVLYDETDTTILESIAPLCGRLVIFLSEKFPHEVLLTHYKRHSIAGWYRVK